MARKPTYEELEQRLEGLERKISYLQQEKETDQILFSQFKAIIAATPDLIVLKDNNFIYRIANQAFCNFLGKQENEIIGKTDFELFPLPEAKIYRRDDIKVLGTGKPQIQDETVTGREGTKHLQVAKARVVDEKGAPIGLLCAVRDITERKQLEESLVKSNRAHKMLTECGLALVHSAKEQDLFNDICRYIVEIGGYRLAWVGFAEQNDEKSVRPVAQMGFENDYLELIKITWADNKLGSGPTGIAIRSGQTFIARNILSDSNFAPWREAAIKRGYASSIALPLIAEKKVFGALNIYASEPNAFDTDEVKLLEQLADDLSFGVTASRTRVKRKQAEELLRKAYAELEERVKKRTAELSKLTEELKQELTERKKTEKALQKSEEKFRSLYSTMSEGVCLHEVIFDDTGHAVDYQVIDINPAYESILGIKRENALGGKASELYGSDKPPYLDIYREVTNTGKPTSFETYFPPMNKHFIVSVFSPEKGKFATLFSDITKHKQAAEALHHELELNKAMADMARTIIKGNTIEEISDLVLDKAKHLTGSRFGYVGYIDPETGHLICPTLTKDIWETCQVADKNIIFHEFKGLWGWVLQNGEPLLTNSPVNDPRSSGTPQGHIPIHRFLSVPALVENTLVGQIALANADSDYIEENLIVVERLATLYAIAVNRRRAEEEIQKAYDELEKRVEERTAELQLAHDQLLHTEKLSAIGKLSASIAHEFNNPLFGIRNVLRGIKQRASLDADDTELVDMALQECDRIKYLIQDLQDFNRPTSGVMAPLDVHKAIDSILLLFKKELKGKKITVKKQYAPSMPNIQAVSDQIRQVILNMIRNGCDAIQKGKGTIAITTEVLDEKKVAIHIQDSGAGIKPEYMDHIFEPFYSTKPDVKGTGLGLSVSYGIIKKHKGNIEVKSEVGKGSTFSIIMPIEDSSQ